MEKHFRIIEIDGRQILLTRDFDNEGEDSNPICSITFFLEGCKVSFNLGYDAEKEKDRDEYFETATEDNLRPAIKNVIKQLTGL